MSLIIGLWTKLKSKRSEVEPTTTRFLFADPSFLVGMGRVLDLGGQFDEYNISDTEREADIRAAFSDWMMVGHYLWAGFEKFRTEHPELFESSHEDPQAEQMPLLPLR